LKIILINKLTFDNIIKLMGSSRSKHDELSNDIIYIHGEYTNVNQININDQPITKNTKVINAHKDGRIRIKCGNTIAFLSLDAPKRFYNHWFGYRIDKGVTYLMITKQHDKIDIVNDSGRILTIKKAGNQSRIFRKSFANIDDTDYKPHIYTHKGTEIELQKSEHSSGYFFSSEPQEVDGLRIQYDSSHDKIIVSDAQ
jgi:hypothetical protein